MMRGPMHGLSHAIDEKPQDTLKVAAKLLSYLKPYTKQIILAMVMVLLSGATQGAGPFITGKAIDQYISKGDAKGLAVLMILLLLVYALGSITARWQIMLLAKAGQNVLADLRAKVFKHIESLSLQYLE